MDFALESQAQNPNLQKECCINDEQSISYETSEKLANKTARQALEYAETHLMELSIQYGPFLGLKNRVNRDPNRKARVMQFIRDKMENNPCMHFYYSFGKDNCGLNTMKIRKLKPEECKKCRL